MTVKMYFQSVQPNECSFVITTSTNKFIADLQVEHAIVSIELFALILCEFCIIQK